MMMEIWSNDWYNSNYYEPEIVRKYLQCLTKKKLWNYMTNNN